jgi:hypothetical protein
MSREERRQTGGLPWLPPEDDADLFGPAGHAFGGPAEGFRHPGAGADAAGVNGHGGNGNGFGQGGYGPPGGQAPGRPAYGPDGFGGPPAYGDQGAPGYGEPGGYGAGPGDQPPGAFGNQGGYGAQPNGRPPGQAPGVFGRPDPFGGPVEQAPGREPPAFGFPADGRAPSPGAAPAWGQAAPASRVERFRDQWDERALPDGEDQGTAAPYDERGRFGYPAPGAAQAPWAPTRGPEDGTQVFGDDQLWWDGADESPATPETWGAVDAQAGAPAWQGFGAPPSEPDASTTAGADAIRPSRAERLRAPDAPARTYKGTRERKVWPKRVAILVAIAVVMVVSWYWVFPWLDSVMPAEF